MTINRITKLIKSSTARDSSLTIVGQISSAIVGAFFFAITARVLTITQFGIFSLALSTAVILKDILGPSINACLLRFVPGQKTNIAHQYTKYMGLIIISYYAIVTPIFLIFNRFFSFVIFKQYIFSLIPIIIAIAISLSLAAYISGIFQARREFLSDSIFTIAQPAVRLALLLLIIYLNIVSIQTLLVINLTAYILVAAVSLYVLKPEFFMVKITKPTTIAANKFLPPMILSTGLSTLTDRINLYMINFFTGAAQVAHLATVSSLFTPTKQISGALGSVLGSRFASFDNQDSVSTYLKKSLLLTSVMAAGLVSMSFFAKPIITIIYGQQYAVAAPIFVTFTLAYGIFIFSVPFTSILLYYKGRSDVLASISALTLITTIIANFIFIPKHGALGAAYALLAVIILNSLLIAIFSLTTKRKTR